MTDRSRLSVSSYSLSRALGATWRDSPAHPEREPRERDRPGEVTLLELPARIAALGLGKLEISHPHLPSRDAAYLHELRAALDEAGVELFSVLVEDGDITHPDNARRDTNWIRGWIATAGTLGAKRARVIAGKQPWAEAARQSSETHLRELAEVGDDAGVRVTTENWFDLLATPQAVNTLLDSLDGRIGFNFDFGNWLPPEKWEWLPLIAKWAESCHAKCDFPAPYQPDAESFNRCLNILREADFTGPYTLIYNDAGDDEWRGLAIERDLVVTHLEGN